MKRRIFVISAFLAIAGLVVLVLRFRLEDFAVLAVVVLLFELTGYPAAPFFWTFLAACLLGSFIIARRQRWSRFRRSLSVFASLVAAVAVTWVWVMLIVEGPFFNFFAPLTHEFTVYKAICKGWVFRPGESIGGSGSCLGYYKRFLDQTTYKVDRPHQRVWLWSEESGFDPNPGWRSLTEPMADPPPTSACEVLDYENWACRFSDKQGTTVSALVGGREHTYDYGQSSLTPLGHAFEQLAKCDVQVDAFTAWRLGPWYFSGSQGKEITAHPDDPSLHSGLGWIDCTNPPP